MHSEKKLTKEDTWRPAELRRHIREKDRDDGYSRWREDNERKHHGGESVERWHRDPEEPRRDGDKLKARESTHGESRDRHAERRKDGSHDRRGDKDRKRRDEEGGRKRVDDCRDNRGEDSRERERRKDRHKDKEKERVKLKERHDEEDRDKRREDRQKERRREEQDREHRSERRRHDESGEVRKDQPEKLQRDRQHRGEYEDKRDKDIQEDRRRSERTEDKEEQRRRKEERERRHKERRHHDERRKHESESKERQDLKKSDDGVWNSRVDGERTERDKERHKKEEEDVDRRHKDRKHREEEDVERNHKERSSSKKSSLGKNLRNEKREEETKDNEVVSKQQKADGKNGEVHVEKADLAEQEYEEDFEDYEEDFEDMDESAAEGEDEDVPEVDDGKEVQTTQRSKEIEAIRRAMAEENERAGTDQSRRSTSREEQEDRPKWSKGSERNESKTSRRGKFINFVAAKQREVSKKVATKQKKRSTELLRLIDLDFSMTFSLLDISPVSEYEMYIKSFGNANTKQAYAQCNEDNADRDIQTEEIEMCEKWTQHPPEYSGACGDPNFSQEARDKTRTGIILDSQCLVSFLRSASQVMVVLLEEDQAERKSLRKLKTQTDLLSFSDGSLQLNTKLPFLL
ncbi:hypothetical protein ILYODFUR_021103, partial [Ilyodon furcidens]